MSTEYCDHLAEILAAIRINIKSLIHYDISRTAVLL